LKVVRGLEGGGALVKEAPHVTERGTRLGVLESTECDELSDSALHFESGAAFTKRSKFVAVCGFGGGKFALDAGEGLGFGAAFLRCGGIGVRVGGKGVADTPPLVACFSFCVCFRLWGTFKVHE
jgi:hypothetical protein